MKNRRKTGTLAVLFVLLLAGMIFSCDNPTDDGTWAKAYSGADASSIFRESIQLKDGSHVIFDAISASLVKLDSTGSVTWQKQLSIDGKIPFPDSINATPDGGMLLLYGNYEPQTPRYGAMRLVKLDREGALLWHRAYFNQSVSAESWPVVSVDETTGAIYATGYDDYTQFAKKIGADGNLLWTKIINTFSQRYNSNNECVLTALPGGGCVVETTLGYSTDGVCSVARLDAGGTMMWKKSINSSGVPDNVEMYPVDRLYAVDGTSDGGYIVFGSKEGTPWVMKLDASGSKTWVNMLTGIVADQKYPATLISDSRHVGGLSICQTDDGGYAVAGTSTYKREYYTTKVPLRRINFVDVAAWIVKMNAGGSITWQKSYRDKQTSASFIDYLNENYPASYVTEYRNSIGIHSFYALRDGGFMATGKTDFYGSEETNGLAFVTDENGSITDTELKISALGAAAGAIDCIITDLGGESIDAESEVEDLIVTVETRSPSFTVTGI